MIFQGEGGSDPMSSLWAMSYVVSHLFFNINIFKTLVQENHQRQKVSSEGSPVIVLVMIWVQTDSRSYHQTTQAD